MELTDYRGKLDIIDNELFKLFAERMDIAAEIAAWKKDNHMPVLDLRREKEKLRTLEEQSPEELKEYTASLAPAIQHSCPVIPFVELINARCPRNIRSKAIASNMSP